MWVGVTGFAQHGKDTVANLLVREFGFTRRAFADALRAGMAKLNPVIPYETPGDVSWARYNDLVETEGYEQAKKRPEVRRLLQVFGTEVARDLLGQDVWVKALFKASLNDENLVVPDVRFANEGDFIEKEGTLIAVRRLNPDFTPFDNGLGMDHPSEAYIPNLIARSDALFVATNTEELEESVRSWMADRIREGAIRV